MVKHQALMPSCGLAGLPFFLFIFLYSFCSLSPTVNMNNINGAMDKIESNLNIEKS